MKGAIDEGAPFPDDWLAHPDNAIVANAALGMGLDALALLSAARERAGELEKAAQASWAASMMKGIEQGNYNDLV